MRSSSDSVPRCASIRSTAGQAQNKVEQLQARVAELQPLASVLSLWQHIASSLLCSARADEADELAQELARSKEATEKLRSQLQAEETARAAASAKIEILSQNNTALQQRCERTVALESE